MPESPKLGLFEAVGIELEYMIVDRTRLDVLPVCDRVLAAQAGEITSDVELDGVCWSNELVCHVIEIKNSTPAPQCADLAARFQGQITQIGGHLEPLGGRLMPTAMHPWMDPLAETRLWPHDCSAIYEAFNRIFDCRGHGWSNLQSVHVNLPFRDDEEFGRLHAAIRLVLPIIPGLAASSPIVDGRATGLLDNRMDAYRRNCAKIPSITGLVIPEPVFTIEEYSERILRRIYRDVAAYDPEGILQDEWANARGAIARFSRNTIEIRVIDVQECPAADLAIAAAITEVLKLLVGETWSDLQWQQAWPTEPLADLFEVVVRDGENALITDAQYLRTLGWDSSSACTAGELWRHLIETAYAHNPQALSFAQETLTRLLQGGTLAGRILKKTGQAPSRACLQGVYRQLADCLAAGEMFRI